MEINKTIIFLLALFFSLDYIMRNIEGMVKKADVDSWSGIIATTLWSALYYLSQL